MAGEVEKSLKLNKNLSDNLGKAIKLDRAIKIGWGSQGDAKPKDGEIGIAPHLPKGARIRLLGNLGDFTSACCNGASFTLEGNAMGWFGAWNRNGRLVVERDAGPRCGHGMSEGRIAVLGNAGDEAGSGMSGGTLLIRGHAGRRVGMGMTGGLIVVIGDCKADAGQGMSGGRIIVNGRLLPHGEGATQRSLKAAEHKEIKPILEEHGMRIIQDSMVVEADPVKPITCIQPECTTWGDFSGIGLMGSGASLDGLAPIDTVTLLTREGEEKGLVLPLPVIPMLESGKGLAGRYLSDQPCLVRNSPRNNDILLIDEHNVTIADALLPNAAGVCLDLDGLPVVHDGEVNALLTAMRSHLGKNKPVAIVGRVDSIETIHRMANDQAIDAIFIRLATPAGISAPAALPRIGLSARDSGATESGLTQVLTMPWRTAGKDVAISVAAGCGLVCADPFSESDMPSSQKAVAAKVEEWLSEVAAELRGCMADLGLDSLEALRRHHLRALDHDTAAQSGLRLAGYDRPLPEWLGQ
jgi:formylmethanofuran dehydrogenase subunit C